MKSSSIMNSLRNLSRLAMLGFLALIITSCGGGGGSAGVNLGTSGGDGGTHTALFTTAQSTITIAPGDVAPFTVGGGTAPYSATSSNTGVATATVEGTTLTITGIAGPEATIQVRDAVGAIVTISVKVGSVNALFVNAPSSITMATGASSTFPIGGGTGPYSASSSNSSVATASVIVSGSSSILSVTSVAVGSANVSVFDSTGAAVTVAVTVSAVSSTPMKLTPNSATGNVGDVLNFIVSGGAPSYKITVNNTSIATVNTATVSASGGTFTATLRNVGSTTVAIVDTLGQTLSFTLTVTATSPSLRLSPSAFVLGENNSGTIALNIYGGTAPYRALTSDLVLSSVSITGTASAPTVTVGLGSQGNRCVIPTTAYGTQTVTITVIDSLGASATSVMSIQDNGGIAACP